MSDEADLYSLHSPQPTCISSHGNLISKRYVKAMKRQYSSLCHILHITSWFVNVDDNLSLGDNVGHGLQSGKSLQTNQSGSAASHCSLWLMYTAIQERTLGSTPGQNRLCSRFYKL